MSSIHFLKRMEDLYHEDGSRENRSQDETHKAKLAFELARAIVAREHFVRLSCPTDFDALNALEELRGEALTRLMESISGWLEQINEGVSHGKARKSRAGSMRGGNQDCT